MVINAEHRRAKPRTLLVLRIWNMDLGMVQTELYQKNG